METSAQPSTIGRFQVLGPLGRGGMGVVYRAHDPELQRDVAIKLLNDDTRATTDLLKEARVAARVRHPSICTVYEIGEQDGVPFFVMELLEGETLQTELVNGPVAPQRACTIVIEALDGLEVLHRAGLVHLDLKPANIFITAYGVKLLDFGLSRKPRTDPLGTRTNAGNLVGTPSYMAPEQIRGEGVDARADIFAAGAVLFELVTGERPFRGTTYVDVLQAVLTEHPPALSGSPMLAAIDRVVQRAMAKSPDQRFESAAAMGSELRRVADLPRDELPVLVRRVTRIAFLPFRLLRPDADIDFLRLGLADALGTSLASHADLIVRSALALPPAVVDSNDIRAAGEALDVDVLVTGTVLRSGDRVRASAQLIDVGTGTAQWAQQIDGSLENLFALQDQLAAALSSALPIATDRSRDSGEIPRSHVAYTLYLQANQLGRAPQTWVAARTLYRESTRADERFALAWAGLGRMERILAKYQVDRPEFGPGYQAAEEALRRALDLSPELPQAHYHYAQLETDTGRTEQALLRLLKRLQVRRTDAEIYAGLVLVCRYCGLLEASVAAHDSARALDPTIRTSIGITQLAQSDYAAALKTAIDEQNDDMRIMALASLGRRDEALEYARRPTPRIAERDNYAPTRLALRAYLEGAIDEALEHLNAAVGIDSSATALPPFPDGEDVFWTARFYIALGRLDLGVSGVRKAVDKGYFCLRNFDRDKWLDPIRSRPEFAAAREAALARYVRASETFTREQGPALLGVQAPAP
jgi:serine/threonine-protein kinase